ncbi:hypothetical protein FKM82_018290 [Ascaphus truei]
MVQAPQVLLLLHTSPSYSHSLPATNRKPPYAFRGVATSSGVGLSLVLMSLILYIFSMQHLFALSLNVTL